MVREQAYFESPELRTLCRQTWTLFGSLYADYRYGSVLQHLNVFCDDNIRILRVCCRRCSSQVNGRCLEANQPPLVDGGAL